ncbi:phospholipase effector Tle1 domain-containing protein [Rugamonas aquatica]|uniref:DUF2235 domain-containing protein n=1 Tax=Rugamonas aquatica TaxID=2743357 RepID=A0A6A7N3A5_9BURK|nr:DUF2235 domain-containing protein [Rugamonas aquatica]MQA39594.1 DUF2235 domain-containing protein [Rugamonas aquatica]
MMIETSPSKAPFPIEKFLQLPSVELSNIALAACTATTTEKSEENKGAKCSIPVHVGLFFDGTNNNLERDRDGKRTGVLNEETKKPEPIASRSLAPVERSHSNVVRLFEAYPDKKNDIGYFPYYIPGVGTPFEKIGELTESQKGKAFAKGGQPRITWALLQVLNALRLTLSGGATPLYSTDEVCQLAQDYDKEVGRTVNDPYGSRTIITHKTWFETYIALLKAEIEKTPKPHIPKLTLDVFGFSRGAAEAVAFCHLFDDLLVGGKLAGIPAVINFLGVFDTVASVGASGSVARTLPVPDAVADGHWAWAKTLLEPLPPSVANGLHCIAAHEQRMNFPVTGLEGNGKFKQVYFPGVHSDVGGGYAPGESGKGRGDQSAMLSQIPLAYMFKEARLAGVPLTPFGELEPRTQLDFQVDAKLASAWEAYTAELGKDGALLMKHMELYYRWRAARLTTLESTASFKAASAQAQQDLRDSNQMLAGDIKALKLRRSLPNRTPADEVPKLSPSEAAEMSQWQRMRVENPTALNAWEIWALDFFEHPKPLSDEVMRFFDDYVHDSLACFYLAGEVTEYDKRVKIASVMKAGAERAKGFDKRVYDLAEKTQAAVKKKDKGEPLSPEEASLAKEAEFDTPFPIMTDADSADMRDTLILTQTSTRREGGGYFMRRGYYPHVGFFFFRRSKYEEQLVRPPSAQAPVNVRPQDVVAYEAVWFDDGMLALLEPTNNPDDATVERAKAFA